MNKLTRLSFIAGLTGALMQAALLGSGAAQVADLEYESYYDVQLRHQGYHEPGGAEMILDGLIVRPLALVGTVLGAAVFIVTLPFSALGGNIAEAGDQLVATPAAYTFTRCLGCWRDLP